MKEKKTIKYKICRWLICIIFVLGTMVIAIYPFHRPKLTVDILTSEGHIPLSLTSPQINERDNIFFDFPETKLVEVREMRIYRVFKSICLQKIHYGELIAYLESGESSNFEWTPDSAIFRDEDSIHIVLNKEGTKIFKGLSSSLLLERIIIAELWMVFCAVALLISSIYQEKHTNIKYKNHGPIYELKRFLFDIKKYWTYMIYSAQADLRAEVANSYLNRFWWLLEPFFNMLVYVIVFGRMMGNSIENYATFTFSALLMWNFFSKTLNYSVKLIRNNREIVTKVYVPKFVLLVSNMILNFYKLLFSMIVLVPMLLIFRVHIGINILWALPAYGMMILLSFGVGMICLHFGVYVDDLSYAVGILLQMLMFLSGVFYEVMDSLEAPLNMLMMCMNPVAVFIDKMSNALMYNRAANLPILGVWGLIAVILCCVGVHIVYKNENGYVKVV